MSLYIDTLIEQKIDHPNKLLMPREIRDYLLNYLPREIFCSSSLKTDEPRSYKLKKNIALNHEHIQPNHENKRCFLIIDCDENEPDAYLDLPVPFPNIVVINPETGHYQVWYFLRNGVSWTRFSKGKIKDYYSSTLFKLKAIFNGDNAYIGFLARNPFHDKHICLYPRLEPYTLDEINNSIGVSRLDYQEDNPYKSDAFLLIRDYIKKNKTNSKEPEQGFGRNCTIFKVLRHKACRTWSEYRTEMDFAFYLLSEAQKINQDHFPDNCLEYNELKHIANSIARYFFNSPRSRKYSSSFIEKQKKRGAAGGKSRSGQFDIARQKCFDLYMQNPSLKVAEIAKECGVSERTIRNYLKSIKKQKTLLEGVVYCSTDTNKQLANQLLCSVRTIQRKRKLAKIEAKKAIEHALVQGG
ncbi:MULTISPECIES: replication initiation protein [Acinetobacter]|uniref:replication initiation protein n=1 Tax=Acinetobacter TaxID=469 RepID=UPI0002D0EC03|nr:MULTISPECIES: replication initiation protein [Acinetobacter]ENW91509.1 hypothetical protein F905_00040 [Acinetobacter sp. CIP 53.82]MBA0156532.1 replication initiation protein [Acinetobacter indicus]MBP7912449.1 replication initiation protein [Streptococcus sp.]